MRLLLTTALVAAVAAVAGAPARAGTGPPVVQGLSPASGPATGGTTVTISGSGLADATAVSFGGAAARVQARDDSTIVATAPPGGGTVDVTVTSGAGTSAAGAGDRFTYTPGIGSLDPDRGSVSGGTTVTIAGAGFEGATAVSFGSRPAQDFVVDSDTRITATAPAGGGTVDVTVSGPSGTSPGAAYTYLLAISGAAPGPGGNQITLSGIGFGVATAIRLASGGFAGFAALSDTQLVIVVPPGADPSRVTVETPYGSVTGAGSALPAPGQSAAPTGSTPGSSFPPSTGGATDAGRSGDAGSSGLREAATPTATAAALRTTIRWAVRVSLLDARGHVLARRTVAAAKAGLVRIRLVVAASALRRADLYRLRATAGGATIVSAPLRLR